MKRLDWTLAEIQVLKEKYGSMPNIVLAREMGKTKQAIQHQAHRISLTTRKIANYKNCVDCGIRLSRASCYKETVCRCFECSMKHHSGEGHHNWKGGISSLRSLVHVLLKPVWIDPIFRRDHFTCQFCQKHGGDLEAHHIKSYSRIRDEILKQNPDVNLKTFEGKKGIALKIVAAHKLTFGITLCLPCHVNVHDEKRGELLGSPERDNQQPSASNVLEFVEAKVQRLMGEDAQSNNPDTSAPHGSSIREDIV